jgi:hypothetical protein
MWAIRVGLLLLAVLVLPAAFAQAEAAQEPPFPVPIYFFWGDGCPVCANQKEFHVALKEAFPNAVVHDYEVYYVTANRSFMEAMAAAYGRSVSGVPMTFIGDEAWVGFSQPIAQQMVASVERYSGYRAPDPIDRLEERYREFLPTPSAAPPGDLAPISNQAQIELPFVGVIDLSGTNLWLATGLIAFVDGFNPCSLWVLALLLAVVVNTRSRKRVLFVGLTFLVVTAAVYGLFIAGLFTIFSYIGFLGWIRVLVALLALGFAAINIKDYFAYKQGISLSIDDAHKPGIYARIRRIMQAEASLPATLFATGGMALGVTLVELPCTAGLPVIWTTLLADAGVMAGLFAVMLLVYMLIYLLDELLVFGVVVGTMRAARLEERGGRVLKLIGGAVMLALALVMLVSPKLLESIPGTFAVFGGAIGGALVIVLAHRFVHPASSPWGGAAPRG